MTMTRPRRYLHKSLEVRVVPGKGRGVVATAPHSPGGSPEVESGDDFPGPNLRLWRGQRRAVAFHTPSHTTFHAPFHTLGEGMGNK